MRYRPLALFALTAGLIVLAGEFPSADAQVPKQGKNKNKNKKGADPVPSPPAEITPAKPLLPSTLSLPSGKDAAAIARLIDSEVARKLVEAKLIPSAICSDEEFLRRAYLDITGTIPTLDQARTFLDSREPNKREKLIDALLADPSYGKRMADIWTPKLFPRDSANRYVQKEPLYKWLEGEFNQNAPWNKLVTELVTASGEVDQNPAVTYFLANRSIDKLTDTCGQHFLGVQIQCAQCHNHPFTSWKQTEYWGMAAFFSKVKADNPKNPNKGADNNKLTVTEGPGRSKQKDFLPESAKAITPTFLGGPTAAISTGEPYRPALARWMTSKENPYFSRAPVNRTWAHLMGRGFVNPIDDMKPENEPSHPELMDALAYHSGATGFDVKYLVKAICLSEVYQRTSKPTADNKADTKLFSHMTVKVMSPEQLYDSLHRVVGTVRGDGARGQKGGMMKGQPATPRDRFVNFFLAGAETGNAIDYELGIPQALQLMNSPQYSGPAALRGVIGSATAPDEVIERIYLAALSRRPTADEKKMLGEIVAKSPTRAAVYGDILWACLNSSEFTLVR